MGGCNDAKRHGVTPGQPAAFNESHRSGVLGRQTSGAEQFARKAAISGCRRRRSGGSARHHLVFYDACSPRPSRGVVGQRHCCEGRAQAPRRRFAPVREGERNGVREPRREAWRRATELRLLVALYGSGSELSRPVVSPARDLARREKHAAVMVTERQLDDLVPTGNGLDWGVIVRLCIDGSNRSGDECAANDERQSDASKRSGRHLAGQGFHFGACCHAWGAGAGSVLYEPPLHTRISSPNSTRRGIDHWTIPRGRVRKSVRGAGPSAH